MRVVVVVVGRSINVDSFIKIVKKVEFFFGVVFFDVLFVFCYFVYVVFYGVYFVCLGVFCYVDVIF